MGNGVSGALVHDDHSYKIYVHNFRLEDAYVMYYDDQWGIDDPGNQFGALHTFFPIYDAVDVLHYLYQDVDTFKIHLSNFNPYYGVSTLSYDFKQGYQLAAAVTGRPGEFYYLLV
jgi:hypothetical protein